MVFLEITLVADDDDVSQNVDEAAISEYQVVDAVMSNASDGNSSNLTSEYEPVVRRRCTK